jgi:hypothetical membrane protein
MTTVLTQLRESLAQGQVTDHLRAFDEALSTEGIVMGTIPAPTADSSSRRESGDRKTATVAPTVSYAETERRVADRMKLLHEQRLAKERERVLQIRKNTEHASGEIQTYFNDVQGELSSRVKSRALEVFHQYGAAVLQPPSATVLDPESVQWDNLNQQVEMIVLSIRGVRNKVPAGKYVLLVSKLTQLGGWNMPWSSRTARSRVPPPCHLHDDNIPYSIRAACEICNGKVGSTVPIDFAGTMESHSMQFDSTLYTFMPPQTSIKPYQTLLFELVQLPSGTKKKPHTVAWGCFPTVNSTFNIVRGKFRVPLLRGCVRDDFRHYTTIQQHIQSDIENWFANLYFEVYPKPRVFFGRNEFELQSKAYSKLLRLEDREDQEWESLEESKGSKWESVRKKVLTSQKYEEGDGKKQIVWSDYTGNVNGTRTTIIRSWFVQLQYCWRAMLDELSLRNPRSHKFWLVLLIFLMTLYAQLFLHGVGVYTALTMLHIPIMSSTPEVYGFVNTYRVYFTTAFQEIWVVMFAELVNLTVTGMLVLVSALFKYATGNFPEQFSKFVFTSAITMLLVPYIQLILSYSMDLGYDDISRLRSFCEFHKYADFIAVGAFLVVYGNISAVLLVLVYIYTMRIHLNGILQDSYWRINVARDEVTLFTPGDFEVSLPEITWILEKAEGWRGVNGQRRKVTVEQLVTTDEHDSKYAKKELRVAIYELDCGLTEKDIALWLKYKSAKLYREFYVLENGSIVEAVHSGADKSAALSTSWAVAQWKQKMKSIFGLKKEKTVTYE